ncbi:YkvI family membrane protein [Corynebacterium uterequi]|uniref:Putative membrane protein n=1 Tax=Corynebacterium uterequi TaxID=1072256 RepID=A0A0G3H9Z7_9CORY|nr:membrane protein [Corynebacterium uterequi]AKK10171.1 putative membrane protein [Corynebacterium uterequi]
MFKRALSIALAFTGIIVGAGFASGQEALQFFVAFGLWGVAGAAVASILMIVTGVALLQLGSYFQAQEHMSVLGRISNKVVAWILDISTIVTLFAIGFVMFAGGGSNLNQQFGLPVWVGALIMLVLVLITGMLDVDKVTAVIGAITPFVIIFILFVTIWTISTSEWDFAGLHAYAVDNVATTLPNWWISALNYIGLCVMTAVSMAIVIGGNMMDTKAAGYGGVLGGLFFLVMLFLLVLALFAQVETVTGAAMPVLALINNIHPSLGIAMTFVVFGMIFNTAVGMFYALGKRLTRKRRSLYRPVYIVACLIGFVLSFVGFESLVAYVYPALGYMGILMIVVLSAAWLRGRTKLTAEGRRRARALALTERKLDPRMRFSKRNERELAKLTKDSNIEDAAFTESIEEEIYDKLEADDDLPDYDREEESDTVTYVTHTEPVAQGDTNYVEVDDDASDAAERNEKR